MTEEATLLPCPFCGGEASDAGHIRYSRPLVDVEWADGSQITEAFRVNCVKCGIANGRSGLVDGYQTKAEAIERWNTRPLTSLLNEAMEALGAMVEWSIKRGPFDEPLGESEQEDEVNAAAATLAKLKSQTKGDPA